jgi:hypothetical protein
MPTLRETVGPALRRKHRMIGEFVLPKSIVGQCFGLRK